MVEFFVNLKRFDIPRALGGICPYDNPVQWIRSVAEELVALGVGQTDDYSLVFLLPESLVVPFSEALRNTPETETRALSYGVQGVFREDVAKSGNFGAFTSNLPASAAVALGSSWAMVGHSEERLDKSQTLSRLVERLAGSAAGNGGSDAEAATAAIVNELVAEEAVAAARVGMNVLVCVGETADERGEGPLENVADRVRAVLDRQLEPLSDAWTRVEPGVRLTIGYEPRWAIGPGKTPPDAEYIGFVGDHIRATLERSLGLAPFVVYGGGLKRENAAQIAGIASVEGGLIALTNFTGEIGFTPDGLAEIISAYFGA